MGKVLSFLLLLALAACATPMSSPTAEPQPTVMALPAPKGALTFVEFFAVS